MRITVASIVTTGDLTTYFKGYINRSEWESSVKDGTFFAWCEDYTVKIKPKGAMYNVRITSKDDQSDTDERVTDDPAEFIVEFLGTGTPGDAFFKERLSISPNILRDILLRLSAGVDGGSVGPRRLTRTLRRAMIMMDIVVPSNNLDVMVRRIFSAAFKFARSRDDFEIQELARLKAEMAEKGWKVKVKPDARDLPILIVDIGGLYEAVVSIDHQSWDCRFELNGADIVEDIVTDDPIAAFQSFFKTNNSNSGVSPTGDTEPYLGDTKRIRKPREAV